MKILFCHLLNNYTGSPKVLAIELGKLVRNPEYEISLLTSKTDGILSGLDEITYYNNWYRWSNNRFLLGILFVLTQIRSFFFVLFHHYDIVYINTVLPFGAALAAKIRHEKIIYHIHEVYLNPGFIKKLYNKIMKLCANSVICVSKYVQVNNFDVIDRSCVIYNPVENHELLVNTNDYLRTKFNNKIIFMPASLKVYKGINQFVELAKLNLDFSFILLCSATTDEIHTYFKDVTIPKNLVLVEKQKNLINFYKDATITLNLSLPDKWVETFGLTLTESFSVYTPVIAPIYGGPKEIVLDGENGILVNPYDLEKLNEAIKKITTNFNVYKHYAISTQNSVKRFDEKLFLQKICLKINEVLI